MRAKKVDESQQAIVDHIRRLGGRVFIGSAIGAGFPDLVVAFPGGRTCLVECKTGNRKLNKLQQQFHAEWPGALFVVRTPADAEQQLTMWLGGREV